MRTTDEKFVVQLTVQQLKEIICEVIATSFTANTLPKYESTATERGKKLTGLRELSKHIGCGVNSALKIKNEGKVPYSKIGNRFYFYSNEVDIALQHTV
ncbi:MAG: hypothetical protein FWD09_00440 [Lentimicrobiaceae bacterium]|nr:hypothetical protein [Lentimicrobiaceae bacterium]